MRMDEQVAFFIAKHIRSNVRELEGALKRVLAYSSFHGQEISLALAKEALRDLLAVQNRQISIENIQKTVADYYKIKISDMHSKKRSRAVARPRQVAMALAKELTQMSLPEIGSTSAAATTRPCCTPAARSPSCARSHARHQPRRQLPAAGAAQLKRSQVADACSQKTGRSMYHISADLRRWKIALSRVIICGLSREFGQAVETIPKSSTAPHTSYPTALPCSQLA